jgi:hypothetical protein
MKILLPLGCIVIIAMSGNRQNHDSTEQREKVRAEIRERYDISADEQMENFTDEIKEIMTSDMHWFIQNFDRVLDIRTEKEKDSEIGSAIQIYKIADVYAIWRHNAVWGDKEVIESLEETNFEWIEWEAIEADEQEGWTVKVYKDEIQVAAEGVQKRV